MCHTVLARLRRRCTGDFLGAQQELAQLQYSRYRTQEATRSVAADLGFEGRGGRRHKFARNYYPAL